MNYHCPRPPKQRAFDTSLLMWRRRFLSGTAFSPASLFASGEDGGWYDPSDLTSMYVGRNGSGGNPTAGSVVGVVLDKSQMGGQTAASFIAGQPELADVFADTGSDWSISGTTLTGLGTAGGSTAFDNTATVAGQYYLVTYVVTRVDGLAQSRIGSTFLETIGSSGTRTFVVKAAGSAGLSFTSSGSFDGTIEVVTFKAIPGNHLVAPSDAARPVLRDEIVDGTSVDVSTSDEEISNGTFDDATGWTLSGAATISGGKLNFTSSGQTASFAVSGIENNAWYLVEAEILDYTFGGLNVRVGDFAYVSMGTTPGVKKVLCRASTASTTFTFQCAGGGATFSVDNVSCRKVPASAARRYYLDFDGVDDALTGTGASFTGAATICVGANFVSDVTTRTLIEVSAPTRGDALAAFITFTDVMTLNVRAAGFTGQANIAPVNSSGLPRVFIGQAKQDDFEFWRDGTSVGTDTSGTWPATTATDLSLGANTDAGSPVIADVYGAILINRELTDVERENLEIYLANKSGATLA